MEIKKEDACRALIDGKLIIAYFGKNGDYKVNHLATPIEIRLFGNNFCTYPDGKVYISQLSDRCIMNDLCKKFEKLDIHPIFILDKRPVREPLIE